MPYIQIRLHNAPTANVALLAEETTRLMVEVMHKRREVTVVEVIATTSHWHAGGQPVTGPAAYVEVKITRGTNIDSDKARLLHEFQALLSRELGAMAAPAYVVIAEIAATDWGYDGQSQASRRSGKL